MSSRDSRETMLEAAWSIVVESFGFDTPTRRRPVAAKILEQLKAAEIAARADLTTGAFYNWWPNREAFLTDFLEYALSVDRSPTLTRLLELASTFEGESPTDQVMALAIADIETIAANPAFAIQTHLWSLMRSRDDIGNRMSKMYADFRQPLIELFESLLVQVDREVRPPFTVEQFANIMVALAEGITMQAVAGGEQSPNGEVLGWAILALVPTMTRPAGDDQTLFDVVSGELPD